MKFTNGFIILGMGLLISAQACSLDGLVKGGERDTASAIDKSVMESYTGARGAYYASVGALGDAISIASLETAIFTDELTVEPGRSGLTKVESRAPGRGDIGSDRTITGRSYQYLQIARIAAQQSSDLLRNFGGDAGRNMLAHSYAIQAYIITLMAEMMCSGVIISSAPYGGDLKYGRPFTTEKLFEQALLLLDTGDLVQPDSIPVLTSLRITRGRALLNLGRYKEAAYAVQDVATDHRSHLTFSSVGLEGGASGTFWSRDDSTVARYTLINSRGTNGIDWLADSAVRQDPRVPVTRTADRMAYQAPLRQQKYPPNATTTFILSSGIEARMIEAEAALHEAPTSDLWLAIINNLRRDNVLTGLAASIPDTVAPASQADRVNLLFRERAYWFFLEAHRLGDMRRLIRQYGRVPTSVFPIGLIGPSTGSQMYGSEYVFVPEVPGEELEAQTNPNFQGCYDRNP